MRNLWQGDSFAQSQVTRLADPSSANPYELSINGHPLGYNAAFDVGDIVDAWNASRIAEFLEITASAETGDVLLTAREPGKPFAVDVTLNGVAIAVATETASRGPAHWDDPRNWSLGHVPDSGETPVFEQGRIGPRFGLRQLATFTADEAQDELTVFGDFVVGQVVRVRSSDTLPSGLAADTDYVVATYDRDTGIMTLQEPDTDPVTFTTAGSGTHTIAVEAAGILHLASHSGPIGLPRYEPAGYRQYRPTELSIGLEAGESIVIGQGTGPGSGLIRINVGPYAARAEVLITGGATEQEAPPFNWRGTSAANALDSKGGESAFCYFSDQEGVLLTIVQTGGRVTIGEGTDLASGATINKTAGELRMMEVETTAATIRIRG
jgi:hypothetical protein